MAAGVIPGRGQQKNNWARCLVDDIGVFKATKGSTDNSPLLFGVETVLWPKAAKKSGNWHRGIVDAADRFIVNWHRGGAEKSWPRLKQRTPRAATKRNQWDGGGGGEHPY